MHPGLMQKSVPTPAIDYIHHYSANLNMHFDAKFITSR